MYGSDPFYLQSFVVGEMVAHQIEHRTDERFGRNWGKATGQFLAQNFYSHGAGLTLDGMMKKGTKEPLTPRYLIQFLRDDAKPVARRQ